MSAVGLIVHLGRESAGVQARELADWLRGEGHDVRVPSGDAALEGLTGLAVPEDAAFAEGLDLVVTLGGDGSILRAVELIGTAGTPILGVDHGQLGYLTEVQPAEAAAAVARCLVGDHAIDERMLLDVTLEPGPGESPQQFTVLNEVVVERSAEVNTIRIRVDIDGEFFTTYAADGLILATPTGSTAYAFSVRGPIIAPTHRAMLLTPVSPHMLFDRSMVFGPATTLTLAVEGHRPATVSVDGRRITDVGDGAIIRCVAASQSARLVSFGDRRFHHVVKAKFGLNDR
ncbi:MAG: NAD(+)/NADH kinase [Acidimicrobiales bacterium]